MCEFLIALTVFGVLAVAAWAIGNCTVAAYVVRHFEEEEKRNDR